MCFIVAQLHLHTQCKCSLGHCQVEISNFRNNFCVRPQQHTQAIPMLTLTLHLQLQQYFASRMQPQLVDGRWFEADGMETFAKYCVHTMPTHSQESGGGVSV